MSMENGWRNYIIAKFSPFIARKESGLFTTKTRERLLGARALSGRDRTKADFWFDVRNRVRNALVDLDLFVNMAEKEQVNQVLTRESMEPIFNTLFLFFPHHETETDPNRAEIADMLILLAFRYLKDQAKNGITLSHERTISEAVDLSDYLVHTIKGERYSAPSGVFGMRGRI